MNLDSWQRNFLKYFEMKYNSSELLSLPLKLYVLFDNFMMLTIYLTLSWVYIIVFPVSFLRG